MLTTESAFRKDRNTAASSPTFQHRHFSLIAAVIKGGNNYPNENARRAVAEDFADSLRSTNPHFDRARFMRACGMSPG